MMPVTPRRISRVAAAWPPSIEKIACSTEPPSSRDPGRGGASPGTRPACGADGHVVGRAEHQADPVWPSDEQVPVRLVDGDRVVDDDTREAESVDRRVDQHHRQAALGEPAVVLVLGVGLGVEAAGEDDAGDLLLEQHVHVVGLGHARRRCGCTAPG